MKQTIEAAVFEMKEAKADLSNYVETNADATFDESNQEYHQKRVTHLDTRFQ